jgi:hypothetical protein
MSSNLFQPIESYLTSFANSVEINDNHKDEHVNDKSASSKSDSSSPLSDNENEETSAITSAQAAIIDNIAARASPPVNGSFTFFYDFEFINTGYSILNSNYRCQAYSPYCAYRWPMCRQDHEYKSDQEFFRKYRLEGLLRSRDSHHSSLSGRLFLRIEHRV